MKQRKPVNVNSKEYQKGVGRFERIDEYMERKVYEHKEVVDEAVKDILNERFIILN